ncbi:TraR/DksA family transcriptional regulator [Trichloromonas sp.]|uniref:TraR/DksA family transcriptional regulator n=1 Tax=Trichloromonas sp. TaxID=3069249 RepID=UPI003D81B40E
MSEELSSRQVRDLELLLQQLQQELKRLLSTTEEGARPVDLGQPIGRLSRMDALQQQSMAKASRRSHEIRLQQIAAALNAIKEGEYGQCKECGEPIGFGRLGARPETPFCVGCQGRREPGR